LNIERPTSNEKQTAIAEQEAPISKPATCNLKPATIFFLIKPPCSGRARRGMKIRIAQDRHSGQVTPKA
jgi:hypothetical protein